MRAQRMLGFLVSFRREFFQRLGLLLDLVLLALIALDVSGVLGVFLRVTGQALGQFREVLLGALGLEVRPLV